MGESSTPPSRGDAQAAGASTWLQRPETARGRRFPAARPQPGEAPLPERKLTRPAQDEGKGRFRTLRQKKKEEKESSESDGSLAMGREVEEKREPLVREEDERLQLLREGEEEVEEEVEEESEEGQR